jgi:hypothetical protein
MLVRPGVGSAGRDQPVIGGWLVPCRAEERFTVTAAEQEDEPVQVIAQLAGVVGEVAGEAFERCAEAGGIAGDQSAMNCGSSASSAASAALRVTSDMGSPPSGWQACFLLGLVIVIACFRMP